MSGKEKKNGSNSLPKKSKLSRQGGRAGRNPSQWCLRRDVRRQSNFQAYKRQSLELFCYLLFQNLQASMDLGAEVLSKPLSFP